MAWGAEAGEEVPLEVQLEMLSEDEIAERNAAIVRRRAAGATVVRLAAEFGIQERMVYRVLREVRESA